MFLQVNDNGKKELTVISSITEQVSSAQTITDKSTLPITEQFSSYQPITDKPSYAQSFVEQLSAQPRSSYTVPQSQSEVSILTPAAKSTVSRMTGASMFVPTNALFYDESVPATKDNGNVVSEQTFHQTGVSNAENSKFKIDARNSINKPVEARTNVISNTSGAATKDDKKKFGAVSSSLNNPPANQMPANQIVGIPPSHQMSSDHNHVTVPFQYLPDTSNQWPRISQTERLHHPHFMDMVVSQPVSPFDVSLQQHPMQMLHYPQATDFPIMSPHDVGLVPYPPHSREFVHISHPDPRDFRFDRGQRLDDTHRDRSRSHNTRQGRDIPKKYFSESTKQHSHHLANDGWGGWGRKKHSNHLSVKGNKSKGHEQVHGSKFRRNTDDTEYDMPVESGHYESIGSEVDSYRSPQILNSSNNFILKSNTSEQLPGQHNAAQEQSPYESIPADSSLGL